MQELTTTIGEPATVAVNFQIWTGVVNTTGYLVHETTDYYEAKRTFERLSGEMQRGEVGAEDMTLSLWLWHIAVCATYYQGKLFLTEPYLRMCAEGKLDPVGK